MGYNFLQLFRYFPGLDSLTEKNCTLLLFESTRTSKTNNSFLVSIHQVLYYWVNNIKNSLVFKKIFMKNWCQLSSFPFFYAPKGRVYSCGLVRLHFLVWWSTCPKLLKLLTRSHLGEVQRTRTKALHYNF